MTITQKFVATIIASTILGAVLTVISAPTLQLLGFNLFPNNGAANSTDESASKKPLYWVAPMDSNYRRDKPGKSPMGMDLVPVYAESKQQGTAGQVTIASHVINNMGVRTAKVVRGEMMTEISTVGYVQYDEDQLVHIHPRVEGWIEKLFVKAAGNPVEKGQPLYTLYAPQLVNAQEEFLIALKRNNKTLIIAARERLQALQLSDAFILNLEKSQKVVQNITFIAPQSGVIDGLKIREGFFVKPGTTLMSIGQLDQVWVEAEVFERDAALVRAGLDVSMTLDYLPSKTWSGIVDYVYPTLNPTTRTLRVRLKFENPDHKLKPNMFAQVLIHATGITNTLMVPKESVIRTGKQDRVVLALGDGQFKSIEVVIGRVSNDYIEIKRGLNDQDRVVVSAQFLIDSESSKSSDFLRMSPTVRSETVFTTGVVNSLMREHSMINITHEPVEEWQWPEMTMDFIVANEVDLSDVRVGQTLHFEMTKLPNDEINITVIHIRDEGDNSAKDSPNYPTATVGGIINSVDKKNRIVNISREAITKWQRDAATLDFEIEENLSLDKFVEGNPVTFTFEVRDELTVIAIKVNDNPAIKPKDKVEPMSMHDGH